MVLQSKQTATVKYQYARVNGVWLRYAILGKKRPSAQCIVFTPGGQSGMKQPDEGYCWHPTTFLSENRLWSSLQIAEGESALIKEKCLDPAKVTPPLNPTNGFIKMVADHLTTLYRQRACTCGLINTHELSRDCAQMKMLKAVLYSLNRNERFSMNDDVENVYNLTHDELDGDYYFLMWDRRNHGGSEISYDLDGVDSTVDTDDQSVCMSEAEVHSNDLKALLDHLGVKKVHLIGTSSGARLSLTFAACFPDSTLSVVPMNLTGGELATRFVAQNYYQVFADLAREGGMDAVSTSVRYKSVFDQHCVTADESIELVDYQCFQESNNSVNNTTNDSSVQNGCDCHLVLDLPDQRIPPSQNTSFNKLRTYSSEKFISLMETWAQELKNTVHYPAVGLSEPLLLSLHKLQVPCFVIHSFQPSDGMHTADVALRVSKLLNAPLLMSELCQAEEWVAAIAAFVKHPLSVYVEKGLHLNVHPRSRQRINPLSEMHVHPLTTVPSLTKQEKLKSRSNTSSSNLNCYTHNNCTKCDVHNQMDVNQETPSYCEVHRAKQVTLPVALKIPQNDVQLAKLKPKNKILVFWYGFYMSFILLKSLVALVVKESTRSFFKNLCSSLNPFGKNNKIQNTKNKRAPTQTTTNAL